ncbi:MAG: ABC transporter permease [Myxococcota bacterium]
MSVWHIAKRELGAMLGSIVGWLVITAFVFVSGIAFVVGALGYAATSESLVAQPYAGIEFTYSEYLLWPFFSFQALFLMFLIPGITMRLFSEELRQKTLELMLSAPISLWELVLGKFAGAMAFVTLMLALTSIPTALIAAWSTLDPVLLLTGFCSVWLVSACLVALGMAFSASTPHQVLALVLSEGVAFGLLLLAAFEDSDPTGLISGLSMTEHMRDLIYGLVRVSDLTFFLLFVAFFLLATQQRLVARRWS